MGQSIKYGETFLWETNLAASAILIESNKVRLGLVSSLNLVITSESSFPENQVGIIDYGICTYF
jgi:hypothetical protein